MIFFIVAALGLRHALVRAQTETRPAIALTQPSFRDSVDLDRARHTPIVGRGHRWVAREPATSAPQTCGHTDWRSARGMSFCESRAQPDAQPQESEPDRPPGSAPVLADERRLSLVEEDHLVGTDLRGGADLVRDHRVRRDDRPPQAGLAARSAKSASSPYMKKRVEPSSFHRLRGTSSRQPVTMSTSRTLSRCQRPSDSGSKSRERLNAVDSPNAKQARPPDRGSCPAGARVDGSVGI